GGLGRDQLHPDQRNPARVLADLDRCHLRPGLTVRRCRLRPSLDLSIGNSRARGKDRRRTMPTSKIWDHRSRVGGDGTLRSLRKIRVLPLPPTLGERSCRPGPWVPIRRRSVCGIVFAHGGGHGPCVIFPCPTPSSSSGYRGTPPRRPGRSSPPTPGGRR